MLVGHLLPQKVNCEIALNYLRLFFFLGALMFMHLASRTLKIVQCPANSSSLSDLVTNILIQELNLLWMD
jgi:hypothetical protein